MRRLAKSNQLNKGFSLIEVLVAIAVITLISIPLLRTFITSAQINGKAKRLQNATDIAQNVSENFTKIPLKTLMQNNDGDDPAELEICGEYYQDSNRVVFKNIGDGSLDENDIPYFRGNDGEKFYVTVTMNPDEYSKVTGITGIQDINDYIVPSMGDLFSTDVVTAYSQFKKYDDRIETAFERTYTADQVPLDITSEDIKKEVYVYIEQKPNGSYIDYEYRMTVKYIYCTSHTSDYVESPYYIDYNFTLAAGTISPSEEMPELFLLYTPFDRYDLSYAGAYARDEIFISYVSGVPNNTAWERDTKVYIIEQDVSRGINKNNIYLKHHNNSFYGTAMANFGEGSFSPKLEIYSNVKGWSQNVTAGTEHLLELYEVQVYVRYNTPDTNDISKYTNGTFVTDDVYTQVSAIKEEDPK